MLWYPHWYPRFFNVVAEFLVSPSKSSAADPHPISSEMGPPASTCTLFRSNDLKIWGSLSKVRDLGSVRVVRVIVDRSGLGWTRWFGVLK